MDSNRILITKLDAARRQLDTSIKLFFVNGDFVSIHALAYAAFTVTRNLCDATSNEASFTKWVRNSVAASQHEELFAALSVAGNFLKHADRDPKRQLEYIPRQYDILMILAVQMYEGLTHELTTPMGVFKVWYMIHHPNWCADPNLRDSIARKASDYPKTMPEFYDTVAKALHIQERRIIER